MTVWAIIPASPLEDGKSRLADALTPEERYRLNREFFRHTLATTADVLDRARILVVSRSQGLLETANAFGVRTLLEASPYGLNQALTQAAEYARAAGASTILSISCDLPFLTAEELTSLLTASRRHDGLAIAGDRAGTGTNALVVSPPGCIPYCYGPGSFDAHLQAAAASGLGMESVRRAGLSFDIDTPDDLEQMEDIMRETLPIGRAGSSFGLNRTMVKDKVIDAV
jgi:2-phospho-L-lactate guanylyltransferase